MINIDYKRDELFDEYSKETFKDRYQLPHEHSPQDALARAAQAWSGGDSELAQRLYDYSSKHWFMFASPVLANAPEGDESPRGMPISCFLSSVEDSRNGINKHWCDNTWLASGGGGIGSNWGKLRSIGQATSTGNKTTGIMPFIKVVDSQMLAVKQGSCYAPGTEVLTNKGWVDFKDLDVYHKVAQVTDDRTTEFVTPLDIIKEDYEGDLYHFTHNSQCIDLLVTANHSMVYEDEAGKLHKRRADEIVYKKGMTHHCSAPAATSSSSPRLTHRQRLQIAFQAEGYRLSTDNKLHFRLAQQCKADRLKSILDLCGTDYLLSMDANDNTLFSIDKTTFCSKDFREMFSLENVTQQFAKDFVDEVKYWGEGHSSSGKFSFTSHYKYNINFVHGMAVLADYKVTDREGFLVITDHASVSGDGIEISTRAYKGKVYCAEVPSGRLLVRYNGVVSVCGNTRRAAYAAYLPISHPEIEEFMRIRKLDGGDLNRKCLNLHHGVSIPDSFMNLLLSSIENPEVDDSWDLVDPHSKEIVKTVSAKALWSHLLTLRYDVGEPYLFFEDTTNRLQPEAHAKLGLKVSQSNLCTEITLPTGLDHYGKERIAVCCLSSLNIENYEQWKDTNIVQDLITMLDNVIEYYITHSTIEAAAYSAARERSLGLGTMGFHAYLQSKNIPFESALAVGATNNIFRIIRERTEEQTKVLGALKGSCPDYIDAQLPGFRRNMHLLAIAPNASSSILCGNTSPSIEPLRANCFSQKTSNGTNIYKNPYLDKLLMEKVGHDEIYKETWKSITDNRGSVQHLDILTDYEKDIFKTAIELDQFWVIEHASHRQKYLDQAQSINLFFPENCAKSYIHKVHTTAWAKGIKSLYYCRSEASSRAENINTKVTKFDYDECLSCEG